MLPRSCPCKHQRPNGKDKNGGTHFKNRVKMKRPRLDTTGNAHSNINHDNRPSNFSFQGGNSSPIVMGEDDDSEMYLMLRDNDSEMSGSKHPLDIDHQAGSKQKKHSNDTDADIVSSQKSQYALDRQQSISSNKHYFDNDSVSNSDLLKSPREVCHIKSEPVFGSPASANLSSEAVDYSCLVGRSAYTGLTVNEKSNDSQTVSLTPGESKDNPDKDQAHHSFPVSLFTANKLQNRLSQSSYASDSNDFYDISSGGEVQCSIRSSPQQRQELGPFKLSTFSKSLDERNVGNLEREYTRKIEEDFNLGMLTCSSLSNFVDVIWMSQKRPVE